MTADRHPVDIPSANLRFSFSRSAGPGGQNVNKVETAVQLWFDPSSLPEPVRRRLRRLAGNRWTAGGEVTIRADRYRTREMNRTDALRRLADLLERAAEKPAAASHPARTRGGAETPGGEETSFPDQASSLPPPARVTPARRS